MNFYWLLSKYIFSKPFSILGGSYRTAGKPTYTWGTSEPPLGPIFLTVKVTFNSNSPIFVIWYIFSYKKPLNLSNQILCNSIQIQTDTRGLIYISRTICSLQTALPSNLRHCLFLDIVPGYLFLTTSHSSENSQATCLKDLLGQIIYSL